MIRTQQAPFFSLDSTFKLSQHGVIESANASKIDCWKERDFQNNAYKTITIKKMLKNYTKQVLINFSYDLFLLTLIGSDVWKYGLLLALNMNKV